MQRVLLAGVGLFAMANAVQPVAAADVPTARPIHKAPVAAPIFNWTGWYGGLNYGTGIAQTHANTAPTFPGGVDRVDRGYSVGVQGGYNWQFHPNWVAGIEADINWLGVDRYHRDWNAFEAFGVETDWYATVRGRLGYTSSPSLFYVTGGAAFVSVKNRFDFVTPPSSPASNSEIASGWTAGWGIETMLGGNWSAKAEYLYIDAGSQNVSNPGATAPVAHFDNRFHVFRQGLNYRFGGRDPAPALPAHNWTGFYAGLFAGAAASQVDAVTPPFEVVPVDIADTGFTGGAQAGFNWQLHPGWVAGVEADIGWLGIDRLRRNWQDQVLFGVETDWYATLRVRLAKSTGPALLYVTGGAAFVSIQNHYDQIVAGRASNSEIATGWTVGGGIEAVLGNGWTGKTEYLYIDAGTQDVSNPVFGTDLRTTRFDNRFHVFRFGLNYQFATGKAPVVTKY